MEKYILELITENNRVIIPNFGAFIISKEHGVSILFNNFLSFNDGLLVNYVAEKKGIDTIIATDQVFDYVDNLKKELDESGVYSIDKLGVFKKDDNGILRFQQADNFGEIFDAEAKGKVPDQEVEAKEETSKEEKTNVVLLDIDEDAKPASDEDKAEEVLSKEPTSESGAENLLTIDSDTEVTPEPEEEPQKTPTTVLPDEKLINPQHKEDKETIQETDSKPKEEKSNNSYYAEKVIKEKKRRDIITFVAIASIVLIGLGIYFIFFAKPKTKKEVKKPVKQIEKPVVKKPVKKDTVEVAIKKPVVKPKPELKQHPQKGFIHLIVGGFKVENNALKMVEKLRKSGYENAQIIPKGKMFLVSIDANSSYQKMEDFQQTILEKEKLESWMYQIK